MRILVLLGVITLTACGGGSSPEPLLSGNVTGSYNGEAFTGENGAAIHLVDGDSEGWVIVVGDADLHCGSAESNSPPNGFAGVISLNEEFAPGSYSNVFVLVYDHGDGSGSNSGTLTITSADTASVAGEIAFDNTNDDGERYQLNGTFEVVRCPD